MTYETELDTHPSSDDVAKRDFIVWGSLSVIVIVLGYLSFVPVDWAGLVQQGASLLHHLSAN